MTTSTPNITNVKPTIAQRKENETAFVNPRTYWSLTMQDGITELSYELRVRHGGGDTFRLFAFDCGDEIEIVSPEELADRIEMTAAHDEVTRCEKHKDKGFEWYYVEDVDPCEACIADTRKAATIAVQSKCRVISSDPVKGEREVIIAQHLRRTWDAFVSMFNPTTNL